MLPEIKQGYTPKSELWYTELRIKDVVLPEHNRLPVFALTLSLQSAFSKPFIRLLSLLYISSAGSGKTSYLKATRQLSYVKYVNELTPKYLVKFLEKVRDGEKKFLVLPDLIPMSSSHSHQTQETLHGILRAMIEEGVSDVESYNMEFDSKGKVVCAGLISGITTDVFGDNTKKWRSDGYLSRLLPFSFSLSPSTENKILEEKQETRRALDYLKLKINKNPKEVEFSDDNHTFTKLMARAITIDYLGEKSTPFRAYDMIKTLLISSANIRDSTKIEKIDIELVTELSNHINRSQNPI